RVLLREVKPPAARPDASALERAKAAINPIAIDGASKLVLVDGAFVPELSDAAPAGLVIRSLREALDGGTSDLLESGVKDAMVSLNAAFATDGIVAAVADGTQLAKPLQLIHVATASSASMFTRSLVRIGTGARVTLVENFVATEGA